MRSLFQYVDGLLRGRFTRPEDLAAGRIEIPISRLVAIGLVLGLSYGVFMGLYGALRPEQASWMQVLASALKVPLLFLLTLVVAFPSLYVLSALADSKLSAADTLRLLLIAIGVDLALLASLGPVTAFFTLSTESYAFMVVLNVLFFAAAGFVGLGFLRRALGHVFRREEAPLAPPQPDPWGAPAPAADVAATAPEAVRLPAPPIFQPRRPVLRERARSIFVLWTLIYAVVGAQMGWILRPFVGTPVREFSWFRERESNFFEAFFRALASLFT